MTDITPTVFLDFDGTITIRDATDAILEAYADRAWLDVEDAWRTGRIGSRECLTAQMALVRASPAEVDALLDGIEVDAAFPELVERCLSRRVRVHIISDGFDYCIRRILTRPSLGLERYLRYAQIISSHLEPERGRRWRVSYKAPRSACPHGCATCKPAAMARLKVPGTPAVFAGDGLSDRYAAAAAEIVFAKGRLAEQCRAQSIPYTPFNTLAVVAQWIDQVLEADRRLPRALPERALRAT
jgi:2,3-diketo-5-methylthio-1-phosphopentane phosphatase